MVVMHVVVVLFAGSLTPRGSLFGVGCPVSARKASMAERRAAEEAERSEAAQTAADTARREVAHVRQQHEQQLRAAIEQAKHETSAALQLELQRIKAAEDAARSKADQAEAVAQNERDRAAARVEEADARVRQLSEELVHEKDAAVASALLGAKEREEAMAARLKADAEARLRSAELSLRVELEGELAKLAAVKDAAIAAAKEQADKRDAETRDTFQRELAAAKAALQQVGCVVACVMAVLWLMQRVGCWDRPARTLTFKSRKPVQMRSWRRQKLCVAPITSCSKPKTARCGCRLSWVPAWLPQKPKCSRKLLLLRKLVKQQKSLSWTQNGCGVVRARVGVWVYGCVGVCLCACA